MTGPYPTHVSIADAADLTGLTVSAVRQAIADGTLPTATIAGETMIRVIELDRWLTGQLVRARTGRRP